NRVSIFTAETGKKYYCPVCGGLLLQKRGNSRAYHFAHKSKTECDTWKSDMSEWHYDWQSRFPEVCREVVMSNGEQKHRADVFLNSTVVEFQHSRLSNDEFWARNKFYTSFGYDVVWVFDIQDKWMKNIIWEGDDNDSLLKWNWYPSTFWGYNVSNNKKIKLYFQYKPTIQSDPEEAIMARVADCDQYMSEFRFSEKEWYSPEEFIDLISEHKPESIFTLWDKYGKAGQIHVENIESEYEAIIRKDPNEQKRKYNGRIYGEIRKKVSLDGYINTEIFYADKAQWIIIND
ncbi:MAG: competence protein CoiA family protein, partial [Eubacteriales bacterium]|nr:competence protein CoiA family protein [Eubacteriales bacterium]